MAFLDKIVLFLQDRIKKLTDEEKRRIVLVCTAVVVVILVLSVVLSLKGSKKEESPEEPAVNSRIAIPPGEIFLPDEPDFVPGVLLERDRRSSWTEEDASIYWPGVLLERDRRSSWTEEDASIYWRDPLRNGEEQWREKIETVIDEFMERIP